MRLGLGEVVGSAATERKFAELIEGLGGGLAAPGTISGDLLEEPPGRVEFTQEQLRVSATKGRLLEFEAGACDVDGSIEASQRLGAVALEQGNLAEAGVTVVCENGLGVCGDDLLVELPGDIGLAKGEQKIADLAKDARRQLVGRIGGGDLAEQLVAERGVFPECSDLGVNEKNPGFGGGVGASAIGEQELINTVKKHLIGSRIGFGLAHLDARRPGQTRGQFDEQALNISTVGIRDVATGDLGDELQRLLGFTLLVTDAADPIGGVDNERMIGFFGGELLPHGDGGVELAAGLIVAGQFIEHVAKLLV